MDQEEKRLFFGLEIDAPWPDKLPHGRLLDAEHRHITLAFLGRANYLQLQKHLSDFPTPPFKVGFVGKFDECLFLPPKHPHVVAWHITWGERAQALVEFQKGLLKWLLYYGFNPDTRHEEWLPHLSLSREPFNQKEWQKAFHPLPLMTKNIHLYESIGNLKYQSLWKFSFIPPFEELEHTADIAFRINAENIGQLHQHALFALAFKDPHLLSFFSDIPEKNELNDIIIHLNEIVAVADQEFGCPFKAVSFHGELKQNDNNLLQWDMIVDV